MLLLPLLLSLGASWYPAVKGDANEEEEEEEEEEPEPEPLEGPLPLGVELAAAWCCCEAPATILKTDDARSGSAAWSHTRRCT